MKHESKLFEQININTDTTYPCDKTPGKYPSDDNKEITYVTAGSQLLLTSKEGTQNVWAPSLYQSCMNLEQKEIRTLTITLRGDELRLQTRYRDCSVNLAEVSVQITSWAPVQKKSDCRQCTNCGRCSW